MPTILPNMQNAMRPSVFNTCRPPEGSVFVPITLPFTVTEQTFEASLEQLQATAPISFFQSLYVRNANAAALDIVPSGSLQTITIPANWAGYVALLAPNPVKITFTSLVAAPVNVVVALCNFPVNTFLYPLDPGGASSPITVTDPVLDALLVNGYLPVLSQVISSGGVVPQPIADNRFTFSKTTSANQTVLAAPGAGLRIYLESLQISLSGIAAMAAAGAQILTLRESTTSPFLVLDTVLPNASGTTPFSGLHETYNIRKLLPADTQITAILNTALTAGSWNIQGSYATVPV